MTDAEYPAPRVEESGTPCIAVSRLPSLPVRLLVLGRGAADSRAFAPRLVQLASDLGAGDGVEVAAGPLSSWHAPLHSIEPGRYDVLLLRPEAVPADAIYRDQAPDWLVERFAATLSECATRVWLIEPAAADGDPQEATRLEDLARRVVRAGGPPAVVVPSPWGDQDAPGFVEACIEQLLHDATLGAAVERATEERHPPALLLVPEGRRHGLDLARLLEDHRARIGEQTSGLRAFRREYEAFRAGAGDHAAFDPFGLRLEARAEALTQVKGACEEINRDRDPAGWTRLAQNIARLAAIEAEEEADRSTLRATAAQVAELEG